MANKKIELHDKRSRIELELIRRKFINLTADRTIKDAIYPYLAKQNSKELLSRQFVNSLPKHSMVVVTNGINSLEINSGKNNSLEFNIKDLEAYKNIIETHPYYLWLLNDVNFVSALGKAKKKFKSMESSEFAYFKFLNIVSKNIGFHLLTESIYYKPTYPDKKILKQSVGYIKKLRNAFNQSVCLSNLSTQTELESLLEQLQNEIEHAPRKEKATTTSEKRKCIEVVALSMGIDFHLVSGTVLTDLAAMINWNPNPKMIKAIVTKTKLKLKIDIKKIL